MVYISNILQGKENNLLVFEYLLKYLSFGPQR